MVDLGELDGLRAVRIAVMADGAVGWPWSQTVPGPLLCDKGVVEVGEDRLEALEGAALGLLDDVMVDVSGAPTGLARWDPDLVAASNDLDMAHVRPPAPVPALQADPPGVLGDLSALDVRAQCAVRIPYDLVDLHERKRTPPPLRDIADAIQVEVDSYALTIGELMDQAQRRNKAKYERWVEEETPFTLPEAERLRKIAVCYRELSPEQAAELPRPSSALTYTFVSTNSEPWLSPTQEFSREDLLVGALLGGHPENVAEDLRLRLLAWMGGTSRSGDTPATSSASA